MALPRRAEGGCQHDRSAARGDHQPGLGAAALAGLQRARRRRGSHCRASSLEGPDRALLRSEGDSDSCAGWKVCGRGAQREPDGAQGPLPPCEGVGEPDVGATVHVARRAARGPRGWEAAKAGGGFPGPGVWSSRAPPEGPPRKGGSGAGALGADVLAAEAPGRGERGPPPEPLLLLPGPGGEGGCSPPRDTRPPGTGPQAEGTGRAAQTGGR